MHVALLAWTIHPKLTLHSGVGQLSALEFVVCGSLRGATPFQIPDTVIGPITPNFSLRSPAVHHAYDNQILPNACSLFAHCPYDSRLYFVRAIYHAFSPRCT
ncbi:hypothetical protein BDR03DRAFT_701077 [Suillus americanus]|nr:hypothetical protein BDR03DRAFT_701077 [Suillus americanus]